MDRYNPLYPVTKDDVDTFLTESNRKNEKTGQPSFSYRLLIATTDNLGSTARKTMNAQVIDVGHLGLAGLVGAEIDWPASPSDLRARRLPVKEPTGRWAYQAEATNTVVLVFILTKLVNSLTALRGPPACATSTVEAFQVGKREYVLKRCRSLGVISAQARENGAHYPPF